MKFRQLPLFYKIYFSAITAFLILLLVFIIAFNAFIASYNKGIHETVSKNFFEDVFLSKDTDKIINMSGLKASEFETQEDIKAFVEKHLGGKLSYTYITSADANDKNRKYIIKSNEHKIATFTLTPNEKNDYYPSSLTLHLPPLYNTPYKLLRSSTLYINGIPVSDKYITQTEPHKNAEYLPENVPAPEWVTYTVTGLTKEPEISITDRNGNNPEAILENGTVQENVIADSFEDELIDRLVTAAKEYAKCMQYDAPKTSVLPYFEKGTDLYESIRTVENMFVWDHAGYAFEDEEVSEFMRYDENTVSVRIAFTHILKKHGREDYRDRTDITYFARNVDGKYLIYDRYNNN